MYCDWCVMKHETKNSVGNEFIKCMQMKYKVFLCVFTLTVYYYLHVNRYYCYFR